MQVSASSIWRCSRRISRSPLPIFLVGMNMHWSDISFTDRSVRQFAALCFFFCGGLALWQGLHLGNTIAAVVLAVLAGTVAPLGLLRPASVRPIYAVCMVVAWPVGWVV